VVDNDIVANPPQGLLDFAEHLVDKRSRGELPSRPAVAMPAPSSALPAVSAARHAVDEGGAEGYARWLRASPRLLLADTTFDRLQARALGGRVRTADLSGYVANAVRVAPELSAIEVASPEGFGLAIGDAKESPFRRIEEARRAAPGLVFRASVSAATALGRGVAPTTALAAVAKELCAAGVDIIRVSDPYNDADRLAAAVDAVSGSDAVIEGAVCATGALHPSNSTGFVEGAAAVASTLERHGVLTVVLDDRFGALRPVAAYSAVRGIRREVQVPVWVRLAESSGYVLASAIAAIEAGAVGIDTVMPSLAGAGYEPDVVALTLALKDTERQPEAEPVRLVELDHHVAALLELLGGRRPAPAPPPDAADRGVPADLFADVLQQGGEGLAPSPDHVLAACEAAWQALGEPAPIPPAREGLVELATALMSGDAPAGRLLDRARADDPQGLLDSLASLREGGFPDLELAEELPKDRRGLLAVLWEEEAADFAAHVDRYGELELVPGATCLYGLGAGEALEAVVDGEPHEVRAIENDPGSTEVTLELDGLRPQTPS